MKSKIKSVYTKTCQKIGAMLTAPSKLQSQLILFAVGIVLLSVGLTGITLAANDDNSIPTASNIAFNDERLNTAISTVLAYIEGSFGALVMVASGVGAIVSAAFGQYRAALGLLAVAVGSFILRSLIGTFFRTNVARAGG
ncbi:MAG: hypothetical protein D6780_06485 [Candidatus Dadabacteria bacterium]|nr:MAG: hypothetical protein D6780_06485 [Candidatus Dadabacteria bacterium]